MDIWVYFVLIGILISAIMIVRTLQVEEKQTEKQIEKEGNIYMERLKKEKLIKEKSDV